MDHGLAEAVQAVEAAFMEAQYFPVSAIGHAANGQPFTPQHVMEPVAWLMRKTDLSLAKACGLADAS